MFTFSLVVTGGNFKCLSCNSSNSIMNPADPSNALCKTLQGLSLLQNPCSDSDTAQGRFVVAYFHQNNSFCSLAPLLYANGVASQLSCCVSDLCNQPGITAPEITSRTPLLKCFHGVDETIKLRSVLQSRHRRHP